MTYLQELNTVQADSLIYNRKITTFKTPLSLKHNGGMKEDNYENVPK